MHPARMAVIVTLALGAQFIASGISAQRSAPAQVAGAVHEEGGWLTRPTTETFAQLERYADREDGAGFCIQRPGRWVQPDHSQRLPGPAFAMADSLVY